ncbi:hypothetical protein [Lelliottia wanjuensis]|uniref:Uncharacterized protein n=1 Tax=Lelliottia wanjuensis TaxID=3050585 RepID=A0AAP4LC41_9ENTR|nr:MULTISPECIES: hypothetical protein [unclassified Lelliottia]MDK9365385.1 hypothetical protein [Lelliottia sp. V106_12]MDK9617918.1 hypothetical protein [Lelliottia sp. V106_9]
MGKMTFVVEFDDGKEPTVSADMDVAGGRVVAASWIDYREDFFTTEQRDVIAGMVEEAEWHDHVEEKMATDIMVKVELLTY